MFQATHNNTDCSHQELITSLPVLIEDILQDFERKLYVTGGELSLSKTFYYLIAWMWDEAGNARMGTIEETPGTVSLSKGEGTTKTEIQRYEVNEPKRTLGQRLCPTGTMVAEIAYKTEICIRWAQAIYGCSLSRLDVYRAYNNVLIPQLAYTLPTTTINPKELKTLQTKVDQVYRSRIGLNKHFPQEMLWGPALYGGLEHLTFEDRQGLTHINLHL